MSGLYRVKRKGNEILGLLLISILNGLCRVKITGKRKLAMIEGLDFD